MFGRIIFWIIVITFFALAFFMLSRHDPLQDCDVQWEKNEPCFID